MVREVAPNLSYHYWYLGIRGRELDEEASPMVLVRGSEFQHSREIEMEDDEGHTGTATTRMSSYRSNATANPSYTDKCRYKEGWEDLWLLLLGSDDGEGNIRKEETSTGSGIYNYTFKVNTDSPQDPYFATLVNGFAKTTNDAYKYEDCLLSEFEISGSNEEAPTVTATFSSNYPKVNQTNPTRVIPQVSVFPKSADVSLYIAPAGTSDANMVNYEYPCYLDWNVNVNNNIESVPCSGDDFGESTKVLGNREGTFSATIPYTSSTKHLEKVFEVGGAGTGDTVTTDNDVKRVMIVMENTTIGTSNLKYKTVIDIPNVVITSAYSEQSGTDAKQIELEGQIEENGQDSFIEVEIITDLADLHIDNTVGTEGSAYDTSDSETTEETNTTEPSSP